MNKITSGADGKKNFTKHSTLKSLLIENTPLRDDT